MKNEMCFSYEDTYIDNENYWFFSNEFNGLFYRNSENGEVQYVISIKEYSIEEKRLFSAIAGIRNKIVLAPMTANHIVVYDKESKSYKLYPIKKSEYKYKENAKFYKIVVYKEKMYILSHNYPAIIKFDPFTGKQEYISNWCKGLEEVMEKGNDLFRQDVCIRNNLLIIPCGFKSAVLILDMESQQTEYKVLQTNSTGFSGICFDGEHYWLSPLYDEKIVKWKYDTNECEEYVLSDINKEIISYIGCIYIDEKVIVIPAYDNKFMILDINSLEIEQMDLSKFLGISKEDIFFPNSIMCYKNINGEYLFVYKNKGAHFILQSFSKQVSVKNINIKYSKNELINIIKNGKRTCVKKQYIQNEVLNEEHFIDLIAFLKTYI